MPILDAEPCMYPADLFRGGTDGADNWHVIYTKSRGEKTVARQLLAHRLPFYLPLFKDTWKANGRLRSSYKPLFPGYLFAYGTSAKDVAIETNMVSAFIPASDQKRLLADLARVERLLGGEVAVTPEDGLVTGQEVQILDGPFAGLTGVIEARADGARFHVQVELLGRGVSIRLEGWKMKAV